MRQSGVDPVFPFPISTKEKPMPDAPAKNSLTFNVEHKGDAALVHCRGRLVSGVRSVLRQDPGPDSPTTSASFSTLPIWPSSTAWASAPWCASMSPPNPEAPASSSSISASRSANSWDHPPAFALRRYVRKRRDHEVLTSVHASPESLSPLSCPLSSLGPSFP